MQYIEQVEELEDFLRFNIPKWASRREISEALVKEGWLKNVYLKPESLIKDGLCLICNCDTVEHVKVKQRLTVDDLARIACDKYWNPGTYDTFLESKDVESLSTWRHIGTAMHSSIYKMEEKT